MSLAACADLVARADPDRFAATLAAPSEARAVLLPLYAFNVEVSRAPWVTQEPMIAEMRLQWWRDALEEIAEGRPVRAHEVVGELAPLLDAEGARILDRAAAARRWDIYRDPFEDEAHFAEYLDATAGGLMWAAARALGAGPEAEPVVRDFGWGAGLAAFLRAIPALDARGRKPLPDGRPGAVQTLAREGLARIARARRSRHGISRAAPALYAGWQAAPILRQAAADPMRVAAGTLGLSEFSRRARLLGVSLTGRW
jgi:phytoene/squalene synthetase